MDEEGLLGMLQAISKANQNYPPDNSIITGFLGIGLGVIIAMGIIAVILLRKEPSQKDG
ncbi:MAG: hypothetical protein UX49_C0025G0001 [Candidatus Wolfebacteria bacterium GW2011_GWC2_46_275]|uniref:Uncharacterized protein n=2 Tax=Candidatus Wolfeibacteriota TaxID=1752735 RepID=A0A0G1U8T9_9BACT|nr:MAG: hypothetical protein UX70_C0001G0829 [Candidatus Wolfebacteria bacterium GW2011_GWB1_47_1]KKU35785.1 MAG: hypothetical protein UX49_C0025G0001 [Candidatus Wolfebacteria bacterium GW2011_GWC2_46_275]KKU42115.1 MAG: hypothetical protein UX58_C0003G0039 [Candidatus Wolfebacteria bacterium GW2011_GWB2_46_69]KKU53439.1 MAG: hypothetical protein UX76_C0016G0006 [Candidatus Wolfebacteria bacterium GW2011_GWC1_47_103]KKU59296.1 MAG: hypothetical protein UX83_C0006G0066 [Candidatus Wolfebacteria